MLSSLQIENVAVIQKAEVHFQPGLNVLTGETGAGKSILIDSINAILGNRTSKDLVRTGAAKAVGQVIPELKGKMTGMSFRVPTNDVSVVDLTARLIHPASYHDVCVAMRNAAKNSMKGIITCTTDQVVSSDLTGFSETCIFDETAGIMLDDDFVKLIAWYDNEWGYTSKLLDLMAHMYEVDHQ